MESELLMEAVPAVNENHPPVITLQPAAINSSSFPAIQQLLNSPRIYRRPGLQHDLFHNNNNWEHGDRDGSESGEMAERAISTGNYEAIIIGITLLILCLLVIAVIFVMAVFRLRNLRVLGGSRQTTTTTTCSSIDDGIAASEIRQAPLVDPPPAYQYLKPVCLELPPSYEQSTSTIHIISTISGNMPVSTNSDGSRAQAPLLNSSLAVPAAADVVLHV